MTLAYQLAQSPLRGRSILIVDRDTKALNDRSWTYWTTTYTPLDHLVYRSWDRAAVVGNSFQQVYDLRPYQYKMMRGIDFYQGMREALQTVPGITFLKGRVGDVSDSKDPGVAQAVIDGIPYGAKYIFDSTFSPKEMIKGPDRYHYFLQHFKSWEIETFEDVFDPHTATLYDFRVPQKDCPRYFSILPYTRRRGRVQYTLISEHTLKPHEYDRAIADYLEKNLHIQRYRTEAVEMGAVPLSDRPYPRRLGKRVIAIGTKGGSVHPWSGYAFQRIQKDTAAVIYSLINYGHPFQVPGKPAYFRTFDMLMLRLMQQEGHLFSQLFIHLFKKNTIQDIFRYIDQDASFGDSLKLVASLPRKPVVRALLQVKLLRKA